jgi:hypothetical protein
MVRFQMAQSRPGLMNGALEQLAQQGSDFPNGKKDPRPAPVSARIGTGGTATKPATSCHKKHPETGQNRPKQDEVSS